jgi:hypothetical protein
MTLIRGTVNPLNVAGVRKLSYIPQHFVKMYLKNVGEMDNIEEWIYTNLNSRFCIKRTHKLDTNNKIAEVCEIGIEDPKELTMLGLGCPHLHKN